MKKVFFLFVFFFAGCGGDQPHTPHRFAVPPRVVTVQVTIKEDDTYADCTQRGGIWVKGDSAQRFNELVGCIEPEQEKK